jgi:hypothetical protein
MSVQRATSTRRTAVNFAKLPESVKRPAVLRGLSVSQQTIVAVAITLAVVAGILVGVLLWPLGRLPWP